MSETIASILLGLIGGVSGGVAAVAFLGRRLLDHKLAKSLESYKFLLTKRTEVAAALATHMGEVVRHCRSLEPGEFDGAKYQDLLDSVYNLESYLYQSYALLDKDVYDRVHAYKSAVRALLEQLERLRADPMVEHDITSDLSRLEGLRTRSLEEISAMMGGLV